MTAEYTFLVLALLVLALFAAKMLLGNSASNIVSEWHDDDEEKGFFVTFRQFFSSLDLSVQPWMVLVALVLLSLIVFICFLDLFPGLWLAPPTAALIFILICVGLMRDFYHWRARIFENHLIDAIDIMVASLRVGENSVRALETTANSTEGRVSREFQEVIKRLDLGLEIDQAVQHMIAACDSEGVRLFTQSLQAKWQVGGDLAEVLSSVNRIIRERSKLRMQMAGQLSGVRYAAIFLSLMPYMLYGFFLWNQPSWVSVIHEHELGGQLIYGGLFLQILGLFWLLRILKSDL